MVVVDDPVDRGQRARRCSASCWNCSARPWWWSRCWWCSCDRWWLLRARAIPETTSATVAITMATRPFPTRSDRARHHRKRRDPAGGPGSARRVPAAARPDHDADDRAAEEAHRRRVCPRRPPSTADARVRLEWYGENRQVRRRGRSEVTTSIVFARSVRIPPRGEVAVGGWDARHRTTVRGACRRVPGLRASSPPASRTVTRTRAVVPQSSSACTGKTSMNDRARYREQSGRPERFRLTESCTAATRPAAVRSSPRHS